MNSNSTPPCDNQTYGYYKADPGNGLNPLEVLTKGDSKWLILAPEKLGGLQLELVPTDFMTIGEMEESTIALVWDRENEFQLKMLEERIRSMVAMQRHLLSKIASLEGGTPTVVVDMNGSAVYDVRASAPVRVILLDSDVESADPDRIRINNGEEVYVHDHTISTGTSELLNQASVDAVAQQVSEAFANV